MRSTLRAPLPRPNSLRDCLVFEQHLINAQLRLARLHGREPVPITPLWFERPTYYKGNRMSVIGTETDIHWPRYSEFLDFELELACIVGRKGKNIPLEQGLDHIFGFTIFNDVTARDTQAKEKIFNQGPTKGKDFDTGNVLGPWIVTTDEIGDPQNLAMEVRVNGERWGGGNSSDMVHSFAAIIGFISTGGNPLSRRRDRLGHGRHRQRHRTGSAHPAGRCDRNGDREDRHLA